MQLTAPELEILKLLWQHQPQTGKELHRRLESLYGWSYSSTRKTLERMATKGYLRIEQQGNKGIYFAVLEKVPTLAAFVQDFSKRVLELDGCLPVAMFADSHLIGKDELSDLEAHLKALQSSDSNNK